jgi:hypothetical protein
MAQSTDPTSARAELETGYQLNKEGRCAEAIPHLLESVRLDPQPKAFLNLAHCEGHVGKLVSARKHWIEARDRARADRLDVVAKEAEARLTALDGRIPKLRVVLGRDAPSNTEILQDGVRLDPASLGVTFPVDPGKHVVTARAEGRPSRSVEITVSEAESKEIEIAPEPALAPSAVAPVASTNGRTQRAVAYALGAGGLVAFGIGTIFGLHAMAQNNDSNAGGHCDATGCDATGKALRNDALANARVATIAFGTGLALVAVGVVVLLTGSKSRVQHVGDARARWSQ